MSDKEINKYSNDFNAKTPEFDGKSRKVFVAD